MKGAARVKASGRRGDTAAVNVPMRGSRGRALDREISRNITQQRTQARAADRARNRQFKTEQSRAKALRTVHVGSIAKAKGLTKSQVESALKAQSPAVQIKALKSWVRDNRKTAQMAANAARTQKRAARNSASAKGSRLGGARQTMRAAAPSNTVANRTGQRKTLNKFNSRPVGTMVLGKGINLVPSPTRVPLRITTSERDVAFARTATKAARSRAAMPAKLKQKESTAIRASRAAANQKRVTQAVMAKAGKRKTPNKKQRRSIMTAEAAKRFYSTNAIDTLRVNVKRPGFRQPRPVSRFARNR